MNKWSRNQRKRPDSLTEAATESTPRPGDYPIRSVQSRAAARALMRRRKSEDEMAIQMVYVSPDGTRKDGPLIRFPAVELSPSEEATLRERLRDAKERMKDYKPQPSPDGIRVEYHWVE